MSGDAAPRRRTRRGRTTCQRFPRGRGHVLCWRWMCHSCDLWLRLPMVVAAAAAAAAAVAAAVAAAAVAAAVAAVAVAAAVAAVGASAE